MATKLKKEVASAEKEVKKTVKKTVKKETVKKAPLRQGSAGLKAKAAKPKVEKTPRRSSKSSAGQEKDVTKAGEVSVEALFEAGAHFGHVVKKWNPKMKKYLWGAMNGIHIFDLEKTVEGVNEACRSLSAMASSGKRIVLVGTKRQAKQMIEDEAKRIGIPYITQRWMGGLITNWRQVKQTIDRLNKLKKDKEEGNLKKYTKKEQVLFDKEIAKLERVVGGISTLKDAPEVVVVIDTHKERLVVKEASSRKVTVVGLVDSNANPDNIDFVIPMNDDSAKALEIVIPALAKAIESGMKK